MKSTISVVIPVHNAASPLPGLVREMQTVLTLHPHELILVDDASTDQSPEIIQSLARKNPGRIRGILFPENRGQAAATRAGILAARGELILTLDDDGQHPPAEILALLEARKKTGAAVIYGVGDAGHGAFRRAASRAFHGLARALGFPVRASAFRLVERGAALAALDRVPEDLPPDLALPWVTKKIAAVPVAHRPRRGGRSGYTVFALLCLGAKAGIVFARGKNPGARGRFTGALFLVFSFFYIALAGRDPMDVAGLYALVAALFALAWFLARRIG